MRMKACIRACSAQLAIKIAAAHLVAKVAGWLTVRLIDCTFFSASLHDKFTRFWLDSWPSSCLHDCLHDYLHFCEKLNAPFS